MVRADLLGQHGTPPRSRYIFKHALIRDAAFHTVLKARRRELHKLIAEELTTRFPDVAAREPELLAHHYSEAEMTDRALEFWRRAANRAAAGLAYVEALGHVDRAMKLISTLPAGAERDEWELAFRSIEGPSRMALDGWDSPSATRLYEAARVVAERLGRPAELFRSVWGLWMGAHSNGQHVRAHSLYQEILGLLGQSDEAEYIIQAHHAGGSQMVAEGAPRAAMAHIDELFRIIGWTRTATLLSCTVLTIRALLAGHARSKPDDVGLCRTGRRASLGSLELSERLDDKPSISQARMFRAEFCIILNCAKDADEHLRASISIAKKYALTGYIYADELMEGWVRVVQGEADAGVRQAEAALEALKATFTPIALPIRIAIVGRAKAAAGGFEEALEYYQLGSRGRGEHGRKRWYEPELLGLKAETLVALSEARAIAAEQCLIDAIALAKKQGAGYREPRAAIVLAGLGRSEGDLPMRATCLLRFAVGSLRVWTGPI